jgi:hypothetical protein
VSVGKTTITATLETLVGSSSEVNSLVSIKPTKNKESAINELKGIMETLNLDLEKSSGYSDTGSNDNLDKSSNYSEDDILACYGNVSSNSKDIWKSGLELYSDEQTIFSLGSNSDANNQYQVYAIIDETSEEVDTNNNPIINLGNIKRGANHMEEGDTEETIEARVKVQFTPEEWDTIKAAINNGAAIPVDARREILLGYHYALHRQAQLLEKGKKKN